jgi:hypothetical protein
MSVALVDHTGPWTADDVEALPDAGDHARFEVYEGGVLVVSPAPGVGHQRASYRLHRALAQAALTAGGDAEVLEAVNVACPAGSSSSWTSWSWRPEQSVRRPPGFLARRFWP